MGKQLSQAEIIRRFKKVHGDKYIYTDVDYVNDRTKVKIICRDHGPFYQQPGMHFRHKQGCPECNKTGGWNRLTLKEVKSRINKVWGNGYFDFNDTEYKDSHTKIKLFCNKHSEKFETHFRSVVYRRIGCPKCNEEQFYKRHRAKYQKEFISKCKKIHGDFYDYSKAEYTNSMTPVTIICPNHGEFEQLPVIHKNHQSGCPVCNFSKGERAICNFLDNKNVKYKSQYRVNIDNSYHYFDVYIPKYKIIIEYNGRQHYEPTIWRNSITEQRAQELFDTQQTRDKIKRRYCEKNQLKLVVISYTQKHNINNILSSLFNAHD